ncbi:hypothetical protein P3W85_37685, partial [Cupriavidus basilensis]
MSASPSNLLPADARARLAQVPARARGLLGALLLGALLAGAGCAQLPRDINGSPPTARLAPAGVPPAPITPEESRKIDALNRQVLRDQDAAIARQQQAEAFARAVPYAYPYPGPTWNV